METFSQVIIQIVLKFIAKDVTFSSKKADLISICQQNNFPNIGKIAA